MITIPLWARLAFWAVLLTGGAALGWTIESWREGTARAATLQTQLTAERKAHGESEAARLKLAADIAQASGIVHTQIKEVIKNVPRLVRDLRECDLSDELVGVLNRARADELPGSRRRASDSPAAVTATP